MKREPLFYPGLHQPSDARHFDRACVSINRLLAKALECPDVFVDSGAFTQLHLHGGYPDPVEVYAGHLVRLAGQSVVNITVAAAQDYMCEPFMLARTGLSVGQHQRLTIERYDALLAALDGMGATFPLMPVLQGFSIREYLQHMDDYGDRLKPGMWVGVGSVCKRQGDIGVIEDLLLAISWTRPDLRLHGFGVKSTAFQSELVRRRLYSADSMAWSYAARREGRNSNDWREALAFALRVAGPPVIPEQYRLFAPGKAA